MKLIFGVGINDADYATQINETFSCIGGKRKQRRVWTCPFYGKWIGMLSRCYYSVSRGSNPTYQSCSVCEEWLTFSNFKAWMETQDWEGKHLDKDVLIPSNKVYSPDTCVFISRVVNNFLTERSAARGKYRIGVSFDNRIQKFQARCNNPFTKKNESLGFFLIEEEAHQAWLTRKLELAKLLAAEQDDPRVAEALVKRYENYGGGRLTRQNKCSIISRLNLVSDITRNIEYLRISNVY